MAAGDEQDLIEAVVTCEGNLHDPDFQDKFRTLVDNLKSALYISRTKDPFRVRKIEPWNSVRVTISIPKEAAQKLKLLAQQGSNVLRSMGILSVQVEGDQVISLTWAAQNNEATQVILRQTSDDAATSSGTSGVSSSSLPASSPSISSISSSVASVSSPVPLTPGSSSGEASGLSVTLDMLSSSSSSSSPTVAFRSPNVVAPSGEAIPVLPPKMTTTTAARPALGGPFPFVSMAHAAQAIQRSELSPILSSNNIVSNTSGSNAANSTNSIASSITTASLQATNKSVQPPHGSASVTASNETSKGAPSSNNASTSSNVSSESQVTRLVTENPPGLNSATHAVANNIVASLSLSSNPSNNNLVRSQAGPSQSLQLQLVNVPPPYPGVNTSSSNHLSFSNSTVQSRNQQISSSAAGSTTTTSSPNSHLPTLTVAGAASTSSSSQGLFRKGSSSLVSEVPSVAPSSSVSDSTSGVSLAQPVSSPLLVNLLQNNDALPGSTNADSQNQPQSSHNSQSTPAEPARYLLQQQQQPKKTKRGGSLDGASSVPKTDSSMPATTRPVHSSSGTESIQFSLPLPSASDQSSTVKMSRVNIPAAPSKTASALSNQNQPGSEQSSTFPGRTIVQGNIRIIDQGSGQVRTIPLHQPPPPFPIKVQQGKTSSGHIHPHSHELIGAGSEQQPVTLANGPTTLSPEDTSGKSQNLATVTLVQPVEQHKAADASRIASSAVDQSRTLLPITTVNIVSKSPNTSKSSVSSNSKHSDSTTFIPPPDPRLSSQNKLPLGGHSISAKNSSSSSSNLVVKTTSYNSDAKSSTSQLIGKTALGNKRPKPFPGGPMASTGKPRQFLINPLTGHLEPMPNESSSESEEGDDPTGGGDGERKLNAHHHKTSFSKNKLNRGTNLQPVHHRPLVTTEAGVTVARVIKAPPGDPSTAQFSSEDKKLMSGDSVTSSFSSVMSVSKKPREDPNTVAALQFQKDSKDNNPSPGPATVTATSVTGEKIKLRLKLEKNEPISPAYKVDVSFVKKSEKTTILPSVTSVPSSSVSGTASSTASSGTSSAGSQSSSEQPRVPPLHISIRGKNAAVVVSPRREEKDMPPPPTSITGITKDTATTGNKESIFPDNSVTASPALNAKSANLSNSHDVKGKSSSGSESTKRTKNRVKTIDRKIVSLEKAKKGEKTKVSRPKLSKEVSTGHTTVLTNKPFEEPKDLGNITMPVLHPAIPPSETQGNNKEKLRISEIRVAEPSPLRAEVAASTTPRQIEDSKAVRMTSETCSASQKPSDLPTVVASTPLSSSSSSSSSSSQIQSKIILNSVSETNTESSLEKEIVEKTKSIKQPVNEPSVASSASEDADQNPPPVTKSISKESISIVSTEVEASPSPSTTSVDQLPQLDKVFSGAFSTSQQYSPNDKPGENPSPLSRENSSKDSEAESVDPPPPLLPPPVPPPLVTDIQSGNGESFVNPVINLSTDSCDIKRGPERMAMLANKENTGSQSTATVCGDDSVKQEIAEEKESDSGATCIEMDTNQDTSTSVTVQQNLSSKEAEAVVVATEEKAESADMSQIQAAKAERIQNLEVKEDDKACESTPTLSEPPVTSAITEAVEEDLPPTSPKNVCEENTNIKTESQDQIPEQISDSIDLKSTESLILAPSSPHLTSPPSSSNAEAEENPECSEEKLADSEANDTKTDEPTKDVEIGDVVPDSEEIIAEEKESVAAPTELEIVKEVSIHEELQSDKEIPVAPVSEEGQILEDDSTLLKTENEIDKESKVHAILQNVIAVDENVVASSDSQCDTASTSESTEDKCEVNSAETTKVKQGDEELQSSALNSPQAEVEYNEAEKDEETLSTPVKDSSKGDDDKHLEDEELVLEQPESTPTEAGKEEKVDCLTDDLVVPDEPVETVIDNKAPEASTSNVPETSDEMQRSLLKNEPCVAELTDLSGGKEAEEKDMGLVAEKLVTEEDTSIPSLAEPPAQVLATSKSEVQAEENVEETSKLELKPSSVVTDETSALESEKHDVSLPNKDDDLPIDSNQEQVKIPETSVSPLTIADKTTTSSDAEKLAVADVDIIPKEATASLPESQQLRSEPILPSIPQLVPVSLSPSVPKPKPVEQVKEKIVVAGKVVGNKESRNCESKTHSNQIPLSAPVIMTAKNVEVPPVSTTSTPPISIVLPSNNPDKSLTPKNAYKRRAEIKPGALQNTLKRLHDNLPKVLKTADNQDPITQSSAVLAASLDDEEVPEKVKKVDTQIKNTHLPNASKSVSSYPTAMPTAAANPVTQHQQHVIAAPQVRALPNIMQRPKTTVSVTSSPVVVSTLHQIAAGIHTNVLTNVSSGLTSATLSSVASLSVSPSTSSTPPQTVFAIHPNVSIPANFAQLQQSPMVLPGGHKMVPIKLVTLPKQSGGQLQTIPLGNATPNRSSPNLLEAVNIVANAGSRSSSPKTTLLGNSMQSTPLNLSSVSLPVGGNLHFVPISVSSATGTTSNVKVLMTQPIKMQQAGLSQSMVVKSVLMGSHTQPTTIRVIRPANLQEPIAIQTLIKPAANHPNQLTNENFKQKVDLNLESLDVKPDAFSVSSESLFKKLDGVEIVETGSPLNNDELPFEADIIHDEKDLADVLAAEAKNDIIENCSNYHFDLKTASAKKEEKVVGSAVNVSGTSTSSPILNHVSSKRFLQIHKDLPKDSHRRLGTTSLNSSLTSASKNSRNRYSSSPLQDPNGPDIHGEDPEIINSFSRSPNHLQNQVKSENEKSTGTTGTTEIPDHTYGATTNSTSSAILNCDSESNLKEELSIEIPANDIDMTVLSPSQNPPEEKRCTRSTRSNTRLSPDITAFVSDAPKSKSQVKGDSVAMKNSPKQSPTGSLKVLSPTPSSLTITPSTSTRSSPILHSQHQINASNAAATINAVALGIIDKIQGNANAQGGFKNSRVTKLAGGNKRKRQESDSSSASRDENMEDKVEIDLNSRPGKRKCSENAAEMIKVCIGVEDSPKRSMTTLKKTEEAKSKEAKGKKAMATIVDDEDDADSEVSLTRGRSGRSSRESSEDRSSSRGSSAQRVVTASDKSKSSVGDDTPKESKSGRLNSRIGREGPIKKAPCGAASPHQSTTTKKVKESGKTPGRRPNRPISKDKSPLTPKTRTNVRKDIAAAQTPSEKSASSLPTATTPENENARRKTRSSAAGKRHAT